MHSHITETCTRILQDGTKKEFDCPKAVVDYNKSMGGVDKAYMLCAIHGRDRKSMKWWHRIFFGLIDRAIVNSQVVYSKLQRGQNNISTFDFRRAVAQSVVNLSRKPQVGRPLSVEPNPTAQKRKRQAPSVSRDVRLQNLGARWIVFSEIRGRCEVCSITGVEFRPKSKCKTCGVRLCCNQSKNCFNVYHGVSEV
ncbi:hypothetical protein SNE40_020546 [Patella caerulea]|uniref:PiggyBac transposable element-derived protein domain-containing protein n=1 Tax=Patella caerulea TaxID=87958 RepID=A0AAN8J1A9_PATCE